MTEISNIPQPETEAGIASAEDGMVILDGPDGVAVTMTPDAAQQTGRSLIAAAEMALKQIENTHNALDTSDS